MRKNNSIAAWIPMSITVIIWGMSFLSIKVTVSVLPIMTQVLLRHIIATIALFAVMKVYKPSSKLKKEDIPMLFLAGLLGITVYFYFENNGVQRITAASASMIIGVVPIFTVIADFIIFKQPLTRRKILSVFISIIGVYLIVGNSNTRSQNEFVGYLFMLGAALSWVIYTIVTKSLLNKYSDLEIIYYQTIFATLTLIPFALFEKTNWTAINSTIILNLLFLGVFCSAVATYFYIISIDKIGISACSLMMNLIPVVAVIASYILLNEQVTLLQLIGGLAVIIAVILCGDENHNDKAYRDYLAI